MTILELQTAMDELGEMVAGALIHARGVIGSDDPAGLVGNLAKSVDDDLTDEDFARLVGGVAA